MTGTEIFCIIIFICGIISILYSSKKIEKNEKIKYENKQIIQYNEQLKKEQEELEKQKDATQTELKTLIDNIHQIQLATEETSNNLSKLSREAFKEYIDKLDYSYQEKEQEYNDLVEKLEQYYENIQDNIIENINLLNEDLENIKNTRNAVIQAQLKEREIKEQQSFYCLQIPKNELNDIKILRDIEYKLNNPRVLRMLIWQTYYQKPMNQVCANVLGAATANITGIYKITNQKDGLVYIGQAVDISVRWKNHAKAGLGIDTPANNKLYKAMKEDGLENFSWELLEQCSKELLNEKEQYYIDLYDSYNYGYNSNKGISIKIV